MIDFGLKVSKTGSDVGTASESDLIFSSKYDYFKVSSTGTASISVPAGTSVLTTNFAHGLGYVPVCLCYLKPTGGTAVANTVQLSSQLLNDGFGFVPRTSYSIDSTNLKVEIVEPSSGTTTWDLRYYVFINRID